MERVCLAVGIGDAPPLDYLRGAVNGAHAIAEWAQAQGYVTRLLTDEHDPVEFDDLKTELAGLLAGGAERLLLYFAGHGLSPGAADDLWLLSRWDKVRQGVSVTALRNRLTRYGVRQLVIVSDACRTLIDANTSDVTGDPVLERGPFEETLPQMDLWFAASPSRAAWMIPGRTPAESRCIFSGLLKEALQGVHAAAFDPEDPTRGITSFSLAEFLEDKVPVVAARYGATLKPAITTAIRPPRNIYLPGGPHPPAAAEPIPWPDPNAVEVAGMGSLDPVGRVVPLPDESWTTRQQDPSLACSADPIGPGMDTPYPELEIGLDRVQADAYQVELRFGDPATDAQMPPHRGVCFLGPDALLPMHLQSGAYGRDLAGQLFADPQIRCYLRQVMTVVQSSGRELRVCLRIDPTAAELQALPWELLADPDTAWPFATSPHFLFSRFLTSRDWRPVRLRPKADLRALLAVSAPSNGHEYDLAIDTAAEVQRARKALTGIAVEVAGEEGPLTLERLEQGLRRRPDILYLVAHWHLRDPHQPCLFMQAEDGRGLWVEGEELVRRVADLREPPRLVVLASCEGARTSRTQPGSAESALAPRLAEVGVPAILAMPGEISLETIACAMPRFFAELLSDGQIDRALAVARGNVRDRPDWWVPALFLRVRGGRIWSEPGAPAPRPINLPYPSLGIQFKGRVSFETTTVGSMGLDAPNGPAPSLAAVITDDDAALRNTTRTQRQLAETTLAAFKAENRPDHFETGAGFTLSHANAVRGLLGPPAKAHLLGDTGWWRIERNHRAFHGPWWTGGSRIRQPLRQPLPLLVDLADGRWVGAAALPNFVLSFTLNEVGAQAVIYRSMDIPQAPETEAAMAQLRAGGLRRERAPELLQQLRRAKHADPMLGVLAAYLHEAMGDLANVHRTAFYFAKRGEAIPFDIALLGRLAAHRSADGLVRVVIPAVAKAEGARNIPGYMKNATPEAEGVLAGAFPWMRQGWALLDPEGRPDLYPAGLADIAAHLLSAPFTTLDAQGGARLATLLFPTE